MTKKEASSLINNDFKKEILHPGNNGNVKFAKKLHTKNVYWINIHVDSRLSKEFHIILNDEEKEEFTHLIIPANTFKTDLFRVRFDKTNGLNKLDIELSHDKENYLIDIKSGGTNYNFNKHLSKVFKY